MGPQAVPAHSQSPSIPAGLEPAQQQQGCRSSPGATRWEKLLIQGLGTVGCPGWATNPGQDPCCRVTMGDPGCCPHPNTQLTEQSPHHHPVPALPSLWCPHTPSCPWLHPPDSCPHHSGVPIPQRVTLGEPVGYSHNAPRQPGAGGGRAAGLPSPGTGSKLGPRGAVQPPPRAAPASHSPRSRPRTGRSDVFWWRE